MSFTDFLKHCAASVDPSEWVGILIALLVLWSCYRAHVNESMKDFNLFDLVMENGRVSKVAFVFLATWGACTFAFLRHTSKAGLDLGILEIEPLTYIRGRSIPNQYIIVDEAQNLTPHEVKTIITRAGDGTKIVLTGDPYQIDNPYVDQTNNGLVHVVNRFKSERLAGHITMSKGERSPLAELAANLL